MRKQLTITIVLCILLTSLALIIANGAIASADSVTLRGDANGDGIVRIDDAVIIERQILGLMPRTPGADANLDGLVRMDDVITVYRIILGIDRTVIK
jgi:hypothetical protein